MTTGSARSATWSLLPMLHCLLSPAPLAAATNLALGRPCRFSPPPNYAWTDDDADPQQLTDGLRISGRLWKQLGAVGWTRKNPIVIDVDLGRDAPIAGAAVGTAAGTAEVELPHAIIVLVGPDGTRWTRVGDLVAESDARPPPTRGYAAHRYSTDAWRAHGRWVRFVVIPRGEYFFADEVEVYAGDPHAAEATAAQPVSDIPHLLIEEGIRRRLRTDRGALEALVRSTTDPALAARLLERLQRTTAAPTVLDPASDPRRFRAVLPFPGEHERLLAVQAKLWRARRAPGFRAWVPPSPYDPLPYLAADPVPDRPDDTARVVLMRGEARPLAIDVANARVAPLRVQVAIEGLPGSPRPAWIRVRHAAWTDTAEGTPVALALPDAEPNAAGYTIAVAAGTVGQLWLTLQPDDGVPPGEHAGKVVMRTNRGDVASIPLHVTVSPLALPAARTFHLGGFDYTDRADRYGVTAANRDALVRQLQAVGVDIPWATRAVLPSPRWDAAGRALGDPDTALFDAWIARWPQAARYHVFVEAGDRFDGERVGTARFDAKVSAWIAFWSAHARRRGLAPGQLVLLLVDEPNSAEDDERFIGWARVVARAAPDVVLWENPIWSPPDAMDARVADLAQVLCPLRRLWLREPESHERFYGPRRARGKRLALYGTSGPSTRLDPYAYYRVHAWHTFMIGGDEEHFWAFGDDGGAPSWVPYLAPRPGYAPLFLDAGSVTHSKQLEAIRDGLTDVQTLAMLRAAAGSRTEIERLLGDGVQSVVTAVGEPALDGASDTDRTLADRVRLQALELLVTRPSPSRTPP